MTHVVFWLSPGVHLLDLAGPAQVFSTAASQGLDYRQTHIADRTDVPSAQGLALRADTEWPELTSSDIVVVPGTAGRLSERRPAQAPTLVRLRSHHEAGGRRQRHRPGAASGRPEARPGRGRQSRALPCRLRPAQWSRPADQRCAAPSQPCRRCRPSGAGCRRRPLRRGLRLEDLATRVRGQRSYAHPRVHQAPRDDATALPAAAPARDGAHATGGGSDDRGGGTTSRFRRIPPASAATARGDRRVQPRTIGALRLSTADGPRSKIGA